MDSTIVRTVTVFLPPSSLPPNDLSAIEAALSKACTLAATLRQALEKQEIIVQTIRVALPSPAHFLNPSTALSIAHLLDTLPVDYAHIGTIHPSSPSAFQTPSFILSVLRETKTTISLTVADSQIHPHLEHVAAQVTHSAAPFEPNGMANFRFAALANVRPACPFFPAAYAPDDGDMSVALGIQAASLLTDATTITEQVERRAKQLAEICKPICGVKCDFSFAPFPDDANSTARGIERISRVPFGMPGTLAAAAMVASALDKAKFDRTGFCGIMLPVAEDCGLGGVDVGTLLMASTVCGVGLDCVPVRGDTSVAALQRVVADVAALSVRLGRKQLTVRLMPVPGVGEGGVTTFDSPYLVNGKVLDLGEGGVGGGLDVVAMRARE